MQAERVLENSRAGILAKGLKEGQRCPVCGSLQHPELAALPEQFITEEEFEKFETQESMLQEQKNQANTEAEKEKTALEELEKQLRVESISCLKRAGTEQLSEAESLEELLKHLQTADETLLEKRKINQKQLLILQADCTALEKAEKDLAKIQENVEKQTDEIKILVDKKRAALCHLEGSRASLYRRSQRGTTDRRGDSAKAGGKAAHGGRSNCSAGCFRESHKGLWDTKTGGNSCEKSA